jgi:hypothetical protein
MAALLLISMGKRLPNIMEQSIVYLTPGSPGECAYRAYYDAGEGAVEMTTQTKAGDVRPGDCFGHSLMDAQFFACCGEICVEAEIKDVPVQCTRLFDLLTGKKYGFRQLEKWNAAHSGNE